MKKQVIIIGGGFAGIALAKRLVKDPAFHVTLVDKNNYNFFPPLLYQVATGFIEASNISYPFRKLFQGRSNFSFRMGKLLSIDPEKKQVYLTNGLLNYDYLILATGTESNYFGNENIRRNAYPMKTVEDSLHLRNTLLSQMEQATVTDDAKEYQKHTRIVIAGGGPTGIEIAGMLAEMRMNILAKDYPEIQSQSIEIYLVDGAPVLLTPMSTTAQEYALEKLTRMGVIVKLNKLVKDYVDDQVIFADGEVIETKLLFWTTGVIAKTWEGLPDTAYGRGRRLIVDEYNQVKGFPGLYAIGDTCLMEGDPGWPEGHPQLAQPAIQQGRVLARNLRAMVRQKPLTPFRYKDKGTMAIIGRSKAVADFPKPKMQIKGFLAWIIWLFVHLFSLIHYRNRVKTMYNWTIAYFTKDQSLRMIIRTRQPQTQPPPQTRGQGP